MIEKSKVSRTVKVIALSTAGIISTLASILFASVATRLLSKQDYATIRQTFLVYEIIAPLLMLGLPNALYYFLPRRQSDRAGVAVDVVFLLFCCGVPFAVFVICGGNQFLANQFLNPALSETIFWISIYPLLMLPIAAISPVMVVTEKFRALSLFNTAIGGGAALLAILAVVYESGYKFAILVRILVAAVALPIALYLIFSAIKMPLRFPRLPSMTELLKYSVPVGFATMLGTITLQMHAVIVASMCTPAEFAVYINGAIEIPLISIVTGSITAVIFAEMADYCAARDFQKAMNVFKLAATKSACILLPAMVFFGLVSETFIVMLFTQEYSASTRPFLIYLLILPARIVVFGAALMALGLTRQILTRSIFDLIINVILSVIFVKYMGYIGAAIALVLTLYLWTIPYNLKLIAKGFGVSWTELVPYGNLFKISFASVVFCPVVAVYLRTTPIDNLVFNVLFAGVVYVPGTYFVLYRLGFAPSPRRGLISLKSFFGRT